MFKIYYISSLGCLIAPYFLLASFGCWLTTVFIIESSQHTPHTVVSKSKQLYDYVVTNSILNVKLSGLTSLGVLRLKVLARPYQNKNLNTKWCAHMFFLAGTMNKIFDIVLWERYQSLLKTV